MIQTAGATTRAQEATVIVHQAVWDRHWHTSQVIYPHSYFLQHPNSYVGNIRKSKDTQEAQTICKLRMSNLGWTAVYYGFSWRSEQVGKVEDGSWKSTHFTRTLPIVKSSRYHAYCSTYIDIKSIWHNCVSKDLSRKGLHEHRSVAFVWLQVLKRINVWQERIL